MTEPFGLLVVGGGPAGLAAARGYRDAGGEGTVALVTDEYRMPYSRPPLTKELLRGESEEADLPLEEESWLVEHRVDLIGGRAISLDPARRTVGLSGGRRLTYQQCVLATGAEPARLPVPGADHPRVHVVRSLDHLRELNTRLHDGASVAVVGSGFIGCEIAASLRARGHAVTMISDERAPNTQRLGPEAAAEIRRWLAEDGVTLRLGTPVQQIEQPTAGHLTVRTGEEPVTVEIVVMACGVGPRSELAAQAGLELDDGAIPVSDAMRTATDGVFAAGDVCRAENRTAGRALRVEHWGDALGQGEIAGRTAAGGSVAWDEVPGFWSTIGGHTIKYAAWGDGFETARFERHGDAAFTVWYGAHGRLVGVLTHERDEDYEQGRARIAAGARWR